MEMWIPIVVPAVLGAAYLAVRRIVLRNPHTHALFEKELLDSIKEEEERRTALENIRLDRLRRIRQGLTTKDERADIIRESAEALVAVEAAHDRRLAIEEMRREFLLGKLEMKQAFVRYGKFLEEQAAHKEGMVKERIAAWEGLGDEIFNVM